MHAVLSILMAAALIVHAVLGCCWHHAHDCVRCDNPIAHVPGLTAKTSDQVACCKHHHGAGPEASEGQQEQPSQEPCKCRFECRGVCAYLPPQKTQIDSPELVVAFDYAIVAPMRAGVPIAPALSWELAGNLANVEPPLRLHLLHQMLLI